MDAKRFISQWTIIRQNLIKMHHCACILWYFRFVPTNLLKVMKVINFLLSLSISFKSIYFLYTYSAAKFIIRDCWMYRKEFYLWYFDPEVLWYFTGIWKKLKKNVVENKQVKENPTFRFWRIYDILICCYSIDTFHFW